MSPFNPDKFRLDVTSDGGVNGTIDRKIEKLSKKCADLIQKNKHKEAKRILDEIKELKSLRLPDEEDLASAQQASEVDELEKTLISSIDLPSTEMDLPATIGISDMEKTLITTPLVADQEKTVVTTPSVSEQEKTVVTTPDISNMDKTLVTTLQFIPESIESVAQSPHPEVTKEKKEPKLKPNIRTEENKAELKDNQTQTTSTISGAKNTAIMTGASLIVFLTMSVFSYLAFKDFPGKGNYFDWLRSESVYQKANSESKRGNFEAAIKHYLEAAEIYPDSTKSLHEAGKIQLVYSYLKPKLDSLEKAARLSPNNSEYQRDYAYGLTVNLEFQKALEIVSRLEQKEKDSPQNKALLALIKCRLNHADAERYIREAMLSDSKDSQTIHDRDFYAGQYYRFKLDSKKAFEYLERAHKTRPYDILTLSSLIEVKKTNYLDTEKETELLVQLAPEWPNSWYTKGWLLRNKKNYDLAIDCFKKAIQLAPTKAYLYSVLAETYLEAGKKADALKAAYDGLKVDAGEFDCISVIGKADENIEPAKMEELYRKGLSKIPDGDEGWNGIATWQDRQGKVTQALESQAKAVKLFPEHAGYWYGLALYLDECHNKTQALRALSEAIAIDPENEEYDALYAELLSSR